MTAFFQHVGEAGGTRDFPRTIGTASGGMRLFHFADLHSYLAHLPTTEQIRLSSDVAKYAPDGFQVWGIPSGAKTVLNTLQVGDYLLLLESIGPGGSFAYAGRVVARPSQECFELSQHLWGEQRFPLILFLKGALTNYSWFNFCENLGYSTNWNPAGNTYRIQRERLTSSPFLDEEGLIRSVAGHPLGLEPASVAAELPFQDDAELFFDDEEGRKVLRLHLVRERSSKLVEVFKRNLSDFSCRVCGFDFLKVYGELGRAFIEAHHTRPVSQMAPDERVRVQDLLAVCSNCHRMLHRQYPVVDWKKLREMVIQSFSTR